MIDRRVGVMLAVNVALLAAIGLSRLGRSGPAPIPFSLPAEAQSSGMTITRTGQPPVELQRQDGRWTVAGDPLDPSAAQALATTLARPVGADLALDATGAELDDFGLGEHAVTVRFAGPGAPAAPVRIGRVVDGRRTFVWPVGGAQIYRLRADLGRLFERPAAHWPDRRLVSTPIEALAELRMTRGDALDWHARREAADAPWALAHPPGFFGGQDEVGAVAATLVTARAEGFADAEGFAASATLEARTFSGRAVTLQLMPGAAGSLLVRLPDRRRLAHVPRHQAVFLDVRAADLRERRVFGAEVTPAALDGVHIGGAQPMRLERDEARRWRMLAPRSVGPLPDAAVEQWVSALVGLRAVGFADRVAAQGFSATQRIDLDLSGAQITLELGAAFGNGARLARRLDRPQQVLVLGASALKVLDPDVDTIAGGPAQPSER